MARQVNEVVTVLTISAEEAEAGARRYASSLDTVQKAAQRTADGVQRSEATIEQSARSLRLASNEAERMARALDPTYNAMRRLEEQQRKLFQSSEAMARAIQGTGTAINGVVPSADAARERLKLFAAESARLTEIQGRLAAGLITSEQAMQEMNRTAAHASAPITSTGRFGAVAQQAGFQVADFVSQVGAGTNAMVAFGMQAGQLLGFFGPWGAVIGAGVATVSILAGTMQQAGKAAEDTGTAFGSYQKAMELAKTASGELATASGITKAALDAERRSVIAAREEVLAKAEADLIAMQATAKAIEEASAASPELGMAGEQYSAAAERQRKIVAALRLVANTDAAGTA